MQEDLDAAEQGAREYAEIFGYRAFLSGTAGSRHSGAANRQRTYS